VESHNEVVDRAHIIMVDIAFAPILGRYSRSSVAAISYLHPEPSSQGVAQSIIEKCVTPGIPLLLVS